MKRNFTDAIAHRRSYYQLKKESPLTDVQLRSLVESVVACLPSPFNSQSSRVVLLLGAEHDHFWQIAKDALRKIVPAEAFAATEAKIDGCFAAGYGTLLFFEDQTVVRGLQESFPSYAANFPVWSEHTSGIHQFALWTALEDEGLGASLQHYSPLVDEGVYSRWGISRDWKLIAQMPFGTPAGEPGDKEIQPIEERVLVFG